MDQKLKIIIKPLRTNIKEYHDYGVDECTGDIWSFKGKEPRKLSSNGNTYPSVTMDDKKTIQVHTAVFYTLNPSIKTPASINDVDWTNTPDAIKLIAKQAFEVNHIDHNNTNYNPSNLELVTRDENRKLAHIHYHGNK
jgi:hypothetical protein